MIGYVTLGTNDLEKATAFYDALLGLINAKRIISSDRMSMWSVGRGQPMLAVIKPYDGKPATAGNGTMPAIITDSPETVKKLHEKALSLGATDEGAPGPRQDGRMYFGYVRDPEGHKLAFFSYTS